MARQKEWWRIAKANAWMASAKQYMATEQNEVLGYRYQPQLVKQLTLIIDQHQMIDRVPMAPTNL